MAHSIRTRMAAVVRQVVAEPGAHVVVGDPIVVVESMKTEIPITADVAGVVRDVRVAVGDQVREGDTVAVID